MFDPLHGHRSTREKYLPQNSRNSQRENLSFLCLLFVEQKMWKKSTNHYVYSWVHKRSYIYIYIPYPPDPAISQNFESMIFPGRVIFIGFHRTVKRPESARNH